MSKEVALQDLQIQMCIRDRVIIDPFYLTPSHTIAEADELMGRYRISGVPAVSYTHLREANTHSFAIPSI